MQDPLFDHVSAVHGGRPWGRVLDAGTGDHSLAWVRGLATTGWTAVTGDPLRHREMGAVLAGRLRPEDRLVTGNWTDETFLADDVYDVVLADYLLGALEGHAPYFQDRLFARLRRHVGGTLYAVGLEPFPQTAPTPGGRSVLDVIRLRDACILLAGRRCYREYPMDWVVRSLESSGYAITSTRRVPIVIRRGWIARQVAVARRQLGDVPDGPLAEALRRRAQGVEQEAITHADREGGIHLGADYVVAAVPC